MANRSASLIDERFAARPLPKQLAVDTDVGALLRNGSKNILCLMKTVTFAEAQANFPALLRVVETGEEIRLTRKKKAVAKIVPLNGKRKKLDWSDHFAKLDSIFGRKPALANRPAKSLSVDGGEDVRPDRFND